MLAEAGLDVLAARAAAVIDRVLASQGGAAIRAEDLEDIRSSVLLRLLLRLHRDAASIANLETYVVAATYNGINDYIRRRHPERARLKNRLRYLMTHDRAFALWHGEAEILCGFRRWSGGRTAGAPPRLEELSPAVFARHDERLAVTEIFTRAATPLRLDDLVALLADAWHLRELAAADADLLLHGGPDVATALEQRQELAALWREVSALPRMHRAALLLNLRDAEGANALALIVLLGVATLDDVAAALGMTVEYLADLWGRLPLDDHSIGSLLGVSRQQVINFRSAGRRRLLRRMMS